MSPASGPRHWLAGVAHRSGLIEHEAASVDRGTPLEDAWIGIADAARVSVRELAEHVAQALNLAVADLSTADAAALAAVPPEIAAKHGVFPLRVTDRTLTVATADPTDADAEQALEFASGRRIALELAPPRVVRDAIEGHYAPDQLVERLLQDVEDRSVGEVRVVEQAETGDVDETQATVGPVVKLANVILGEAIRRGASDVHIEPEQQEGRVRFRVDGVLERFMRLPLPALVRVVSRIKIMGDLDITDRIRPQDGHVRIHVGEEAYDLRVSTVPAQDAEKCVIRVLTPAASFSLESLYGATTEATRIERLLAYRDGVVVVTGPTGSGKTTTLYAMLQELSSGELNISTVEDPIEYNLPGITQIQVDRKRNVNFGSALRALLRQDPDVILVGEIRDAETARTALRASMTGHLVLTTLHTNDAAGVVARLADLDVEPANLASSLRGVVAQRLVRRLCPSCCAPVRTREDLDPRELRLVEVYRVEPRRRAVGCDRCRGTGYRGRLPVAEVLTLTPEVAALVAEGARAEEVVAAAVHGGMRSLRAVAVECGLDGETTLRELERVGLGGPMETTGAGGEDPGRSPAASYDSPSPAVPHAPVEPFRPSDRSEPSPLRADVDLAARGTSSHRDAGRLTVAVAPFTNLHQDEESRYFSDGITQDILVALSRIRSITVLTQHAVERYQDHAKSLRQIGADLGATTLLEGSVRRSGNRVRIAAQLFDTRNDEVLWAETYDRDLEDIFWVQADVAHSIAEALEAELSASERARIQTRPTEDLEAYDLFLRGRFLWNQRTEEGIRQSINHFRRAIELDESFAPALAGLADSYVTLGMYGVVATAEVMPLAGEMAGRALAEDPEMAEALTATACVRSVYDWDWADAEATFQAAIEANPDYPTAYHWYAVNLLTPIQRFHEARGSLRSALDLDPLNPVINTSRGIVSYYERDYERAVRECRQVLERDGAFVMARYFLGQALEQAERPEKAVDELRRAVSDSDASAETLSALGHALALAGDEAGARSTLHTLESRAKTWYVSPSLLAQLYAGLGEKEHALECLETAFDVRSAELVWLAVRPAFDPVREHSRFQELLSRMAFPDLTA